MESVTTLRPSRARAAAWSAVGGVAVALAGWVVADSRGHPLAIALLVACLVVTAPFLAQLLAAGAFSWRLDADGIEVRRPLRRLRLDWDEVRLARVVTTGGEPALELRLGDGQRRTVALPVGVDVAALHRALATHLGHAPDPPGPGAGPTGRAADSEDAPAHQ